MKPSKEDMIQGLSKILIDYKLSAKKEIDEMMLLKEDLEMDSLDMYEFAFHAEHDFGVHIPDEKIEELKTIEDYVNYINSQIK